ncbi:hypothetical protein PFISCL1PPCAC_15979, partial [Pristionchus fissidentatus]
STITSASVSTAAATSTTVSTIASSSSAATTGTTASVRQLDARVHTANAPSVHRLDCILGVSFVLKLDEGETGRATSHPHLEDLPVAGERVLDLLGRRIGRQTTNVDLSSVGHSY